MISLDRVGKCLQRERNRVGYTQEYVSAVLNISIPHLSRIENGRRSLHIDKLAEYCDLLGISMVQVIAEAETTDHPEYALRLCPDYPGLPGAGRGDDAQRVRRHGQACAGKPGRAGGMRGAYARNHDAQKDGKTFHPVGWCRWV